MNTQDKLAELLSRCKCGVFIAVNEHRNYYTSVKKFLDEERNDHPECPPDISPEVEAQMIATDTIIQLHFYPDTPIGFYEIWDCDMDRALSEALECLRERDGL